jgi:hypothetical protein
LIETGIDFGFSSGYLKFMTQKVDTPVSVGVSFDHIKRKIIPRWIYWDSRLHAVSKIGLHHTYRAGRTLFHVFSVASKTLFFRLVLDTDTLNWNLEEISDGLPE